MAQASLLTFRVPHARFVSVGLFADRNYSVVARLTTTDSITVTYDALRRAVKMSKSSGSCAEIVYAPAGNYALTHDDMRVRRSHRQRRSLRFHQRASIDTSLNFFLCLCCILYAARQASHRVVRCFNSRCRALV